MSKEKMLSNVVVWNGDPEHQYYHFKWMLTDWCNYNCSYCVMKDNMRPNWDKDNSPSSYNLVLTRLAHFDGKFDIELFGGEPTLHPNMEEILTRLSSIENCRYKNIITNLSRPVAYFDKLNELGIKNLVINASLHHEYYSEKFIEKINHLRKMQNFTTTVIVNLSPDKKDWPMLLDVIKTLKDWQIKFSLNFLQDMPFWKSNYDKEFYDLFLPIQLEQSGSKYKFGFSDDSIKELVALDIRKNNYGMFKGFECRANFYDIDYDGNFQNTCTANKVKSILFSSEQLSKPVICPKESCGCDMMFNTYKKRIQ